MLVSKIVGVPTKRNRNFENKCESFCEILSWCRLRHLPRPPRDRTWTCPCRAGRVVHAGLPASSCSKRFSHCSVPYAYRLSLSRLQLTQLFPSRLQLTQLSQEMFLCLNGYPVRA